MFGNLQKMFIINIIPCENERAPLYSRFLQAFEKLTPGIFTLKLVCLVSLERNMKKLL
jgi:hypothetical protein